MSMTDELKRTCRKGSVLQVDGQSERFPGCFVVVEDVRSWGVRGYVPLFDGEVAPVRVSWDDVFYIGEAKWIYGEEGKI
jgi:hypothetical protein